MVSKIIDGHAHIINLSIVNSLIDNISKREKERLRHEFTEKTPIEHKKAWLKEMDRLNIEKTIFMGNVSMHPDFHEFINSSDRFVGFAPVNPEEPTALEKLMDEIKSGMSGVKLYPSQLGFDVGSS